MAVPLIKTAESYLANVEFFIESIQAQYKMMPATLIKQETNAIILPHI